MSTYIDIDLYGDEDSKGNPVVYYDDDCIKNAMTTFLASKRGEFLRAPTRGGVLDTLLFRNMDDDTAQLLAFTIKDQLINEFFPEITIQNVSITPDYTNRLWELEISYTNPQTRKNESVTVFTKDLSARTKYTFEEIDYTGDNLFNFVKIKKPSMKGHLLIYDETQGYWRWGKYLLTNFSATSSNFSEILEYINLS